jgi:drug/metabolite transporter (DMT)-like permease
LPSILYGLAAAFSWGAADFTGGLASRKTGAYHTVFYGEVVGIFLIFAVVIGLWQPIPPLKVWLLAFLAGIVGTTGLLLLYHSMTLGLISIATPVSALLAATVPILIGIFIEGLPELTTVIGFGFALLAIWLISQGADGVTNLLAHIADLKLPLLAGIGFGFYFVIMHEATQTATYFPMIISRFGGMLIMSVYMFLRRDAWKVERAAWPLIVLNGTLDVGGNLFFILAGQAGRLDVAAILSSLFPASTVLLAALILKEKVSRWQLTGIIMALGAIVLMTI